MHNRPRFGVCDGQGYCTPTLCSSRRITLLYANKYLLDFESIYSGADKSLARTGRKQATATEDFEHHISY